MPRSTVLFLRWPRVASHAAIALAAVLVASVLAVAIISALHLRRVAVEATRVSAEDHALSLAAHAAQAFSAGRLVLDGLAQRVAARQLADAAALHEAFGTEEEQQRLRAIEQGFQPLKSLALVDAEGRVVAASQGYPPPAVNVSDRESVRRALEGPAGVTHVAAPVRSRIDGQWTIQLSRRLDGADGRPLGVAIASFSCRYFAEHYGQLRLDRRAPAEDVTSMSLLRDDGMLMARAPQPDRGLGLRVRDDGAYGRLPLRPADDAEASAGQFEPWDADPALAPHVMLATQPVDAFPLRVVVAVRDTLYLATWRRQAQAVMALAAAAVVLVVATFASLVRMLQRHEHHLHEAERLRVAAEAASRAKSEFVATVSHEIRTPMNGILGTADLLLQAPLPARERSLAQTLMRSARSLLGIIDDILDLSKIEAGELKVAAAPFAPLALLNEVHELFEGYAAAKGLALSHEADAAVPPVVQGDAVRVRQVLSNLASNAIKFTHQGTVHLRLSSAVALGDGRVPLRFEVEDSGDGIAAEVGDRLFHPFVQVDGSAARRAGGTGLGLAISKRLVELMGGRIGYRSEPGRGSMFWFDLPLLPLPGQRVQAAPAAEAPAAERFAHSGAAPLGPPELALGPDTDGRQRRVLVVEDNAVNAMVAEAQLARLGCACDVAPDGEDALAALRSRHYDLVLMDCMLPGLSGSEVVRRWRAEERQGNAPRVPILALTANALASNVEEARDAGMDDFITKPCTFETLAQALRRWL